MDNILYFVGDGICSFLNSVDATTVSNKINCGVDDYDIGLFTLTIMLSLLHASGFFFFS